MKEFLKLENRLKLTLNILPKSPLLVMLGGDKNSEKDESYIPLLTTESSPGTKVNYEGKNEKVALDERTGEIYIPGSSLRGVFRHLFKGTEYENRVFGTTENRGRIHIGDAFFKEENSRKEFYTSKKNIHEFTRTRAITPIDSFTGKAIVPLKFEYTKEKFQTEITLNNVTRGELQNLYLILRDSTLGEVRIGASKTRGFGEVEFQIENLTLEKYGVKPQFFSNLESFFETDEKNSTKLGDRYLVQALSLKNSLKEIKNETPNNFILELFKEVGDV